MTIASISSLVPRLLVGLFLLVWNNHEIGNAFVFVPSAKPRMMINHNYKNHNRISGMYHLNNAKTERSQQLQTTALFVRNIDLVEALIFYGIDSMIETVALTNQKEQEQTDKKEEYQYRFRNGVEYLLEECHRDETGVLWVIDDDEQESESQKEKKDEKEARRMESIMLLVSSIQRPPIHILASSPSSSLGQQVVSCKAPSPEALMVAIHETLPPIQPKGFGGSSGFGTKLADPTRPPLPQHCVVLATTEHQVRAARYAGMRVLRLLLSSSSSSDEEEIMLADGILDDDVDDGWSSLCMDDIATPGSYWLNPPHPKDDEGNRVDVESIIQAYRTKQQEKETVAGESGDYDNESYNNNNNPSSTKDQTVILASDMLSDEDTLSDAELAKLLADIDPL